MPMFMSTAIPVGFQGLTCRFSRPETAPLSIVFKAPSIPLTYISLPWSFGARKRVLLSQQNRAHSTEKTHRKGEVERSVALCFTALWFLSWSLRYFLEKHEQWIFGNKHHKFSLWRYENVSPQVAADQLQTPCYFVFSHWSEILKQIIL